MENRVTRFLADYIAENKLSVEDISGKLNIQADKIFPGTRENLDADEFLKLCCYLHINPENIPWYKEII